MKTRKRIGVLMPDVNHLVSKKQLRGIYQQAALLGYDTLVFTHFTNVELFQPFHGNEHTKAVLGEENIYRLVSYADLDGILLVGTNYHRQELRHDLEQLLKTTGLPVVSCGYDSDAFPVILPDNYHQFFTIVEHLITVHQCRNILCLSGPKDEYNSEERLKGFRAALEQYQIPFSEEQIIYGDYWEQAAVQLAERIATGAIPMPDAIACGNDIMAINLTTALMRHNLHVPDDLIITGFDGIQYAENCQPSITTIVSNEYDLGAASVRKLAALMKCPDIPAIPPAKSIRYGDSCGCGSHIEHMIQHNEHYLKNGMHWDQIINNNIWLDLGSVENLEQCLRFLGKALELLENPHHYYFCLCDDWMGNIEDDRDYRQKGFSRKMHLYLQHKSWQQPVLENTVFPLEELIPDLSREHTPEFYIFTPINFHDRIFGYNVLRYENAELTFHDYFKQYQNMVSVSLEQIRNLEYKLYLQKQLEHYSSRDALTGLYNEKGVLQFFSKNTKKENLLTVLLSIENLQELSQQHLHTEHRLLVAFAHELSRSLPINSFCGKLEYNLFAVFLWDSDVSDSIQLIDMIQKNFKEKLRCDSSSPVIPTLFYHITLFSVDESFSLETELHRLIRFIRDDRTSTTRSHHPYWDQLKEIHYAIHMHPETSHSVEQYIDALGLSRSHFQRLYTEQFGISCKRDITLSKTERAKYLLKNTTLSVNAIAEKCGYDTASHFMKQFKIETGLTALQYRKKML